MERKNLFLGGAVLLLGYLCFLMIRPFSGYVLGAIILAFILHPLHKKLRKRIGERLSAGSLLILSILLAFLPFIIILGAVLDDAKDLQKDIGDSEVFNISEVEERFEDLTGQRLDIEKAAEDTLKKFSASTIGGASFLLQTFSSLLIGIILMLFLMYYMIKDGENLVEWIKDVVPVEEDIQENYYDRVSFTTWAVIKGHVFVAIIQGLIAGVGLALTGVPNFAFWTFVMILLGFIPIIGTIIVWLPASIYLFLSGEVSMAIALFVYGLVVVSLTDNIVRPLVVEEEADLHPASIIIGVLGGVGLFGAVGLFIGPVVIGAFKSILLVWKNE